MVAQLGMVGAAQGQAKQDYMGHTFHQLVNIIEIHKMQIDSLNRENERLRLEWAPKIAVGRSPLEVKLADDNRLLRQDLRTAREQLLSLRNLLSDFDNTPVTFSNPDLGIEGIHPGPKVINEELIQRLRDRDAVKKRYLDSLKDAMRYGTPGGEHLAKSLGIGQYNVDTDAEKYEQGAEAPQTPDTSTDAFIRAIMSKGC